MRKAKIQAADRNFGQRNQFVAGGIHPVTKQPYEWPDENPWSLPLARAPEITPTTLRTLVPELVVASRSLAYPVETQESRMIETPRPIATAIPTELNIVQKFMEVIRGRSTRKAVPGNRTWEHVPRVVIVIISPAFCFIPMALHSIVFTSVASTTSRLAGRRTALSAGGSANCTNCSVATKKT
jgi:hypothetical protein